MASAPALRQGKRKGADGSAGPCAAPLFLLLHRRASPRRRRVPRPRSPRSIRVRAGGKVKVMEQEDLGLADGEVLADAGPLARREGDPRVRVPLVGRRAAPGPPLGREPPVRLWPNLRGWEELDVARDRAMRRKGEGGAKREISRKTRQRLPPCGGAGGGERGAPRQSKGRAGEASGGKDERWRCRRDTFVE